MNAMTINMIDPARPSFRNQGCHVFLEQFMRCHQQHADAQDNPNRAFYQCRSLLTRYQTCQTLCNQQVGDCDKYIETMGKLIKRT